MNLVCNDEAHAGTLVKATYRDGIPYCHDCDYLERKFKSVKAKTNKENK